MNKGAKKSETLPLRQRAEALLKRKSSKTRIQVSESELLKLVHELEVHQIELELQNEELIQSRSIAQEVSLKYIELYDFAPLGYFTLSRNGEIIELNLKGSMMLGKEREHLKMALFGFFVTDETKPIFFQFLDRVFSNNTKQTCEVILSVNYNIPMYVHLSGNVIDNSDQCFVIIDDITARKQAEQALRLSETLYRAILYASPDDITITDMEGRILMVSPMALIMFGFDRKEEILGRVITDFIVPGDRARAMSNVSHMFQTILTGPGEFSGLRKDGTSFDIEVRGEFFRNDEGKPTQMVFVVRDITERKLAELELIKAKEKAEESDRLKSAFLANMSHEIRTPMNGILGFTELLKKPYLSGEKQQKFISLIEKGGERMLSIINDLIDISKIESGMTEVNLSACNLNEQIKYIYTFFKPEVESKGMQIFYKIGISTKEVIVRTDREKLYAILTNLVKNAIKYSDRGSIEFGFKFIPLTKSVESNSAAHVDLVSEPVELLFFVKDTGIGITPDKTEAIFNRFIQADIGDKRAFQGAGLGLSISKAYVEMLGGRIWVESEYGKGSTFYFTIPYKDELEERTVIQEDDTEEISTDHIKDLKVLIAEDDELSALLQKELVRSYCKEVIYVMTGVDAVKVCLNNPDIDLILMDIQMPEMNGYEATRQIRRFNKEVIIIAQTAFALTYDRERALESGCDDYITKPLNQSLMISLIKKYLSKNPERMA